MCCSERVEEIFMQPLSALFALENVNCLTSDTDNSLSQGGISLRLCSFTPQYSSAVREVARAGD